MTEIREIVAQVLKPEWISQQRANKYADAILAALTERGITEDALNRIIRGEAVVVPVEFVRAIADLSDRCTPIYVPLSVRRNARAMIRAAQEG